MYKDTSLQTYTHACMHARTHTHTHTHTPLFTLQCIYPYMHSYLHHIMNVTADLSNVVGSLKELLAVKLPACIST